MTEKNDTTPAPRGASSKVDRLNVRNCYEAALEALCIELRDNETLDDVDALRVLDHAGAQLSLELLNLAHYCRAASRGLGLKPVRDDRFLFMADAVEGIRRRLMAARELADVVAEASAGGADRG